MAMRCTCGSVTREDRPRGKAQRLRGLGLPVFGRVQRRTQQLRHMGGDVQREGDHRDHDRRDAFLGEYAVVQEEQQQQQNRRPRRTAMYTKAMPQAT